MKKQAGVMINIKKETLSKKEVLKTDIEVPLQQLFDECLNFISMSDFEQ